MPAHPVSRLVRFTLAVGANVIFDHLGYRRRPTVHPVRVIEAVELVACPVFTIAEQTRQRLTFGDVERYLAQLAAHPPIMAAFAQLERDSMIERTRAGLAAAAANGRKGGRPRKIDDADAAKARKLSEKGIAATDIAKMLGVSRATVYRYLSEGASLSA